MADKAKLFEGVRDKHLLTLLKLGRDSGARPFFRHPRGLIALRDECERRGLITVPHGEMHYRNLKIEEVYREMSRNGK